jgi:hypothetical protein
LEFHIFLHDGCVGDHFLDAFGFDGFCRNGQLDRQTQDPFDAFFQDVHAPGSSTTHRKEAPTADDRSHKRIANRNFKTHCLTVASSERPAI